MGRAVALSHPASRNYECGFDGTRWRFVPSYFATLLDKTKTLYRPKRWDTLLLCPILIRYIGALQIIGYGYRNYAIQWKED
jgi:hypothetical protein